MVFDESLETLERRRLNEISRDSLERGRAGDRVAFPSWSESGNAKGTFETSKDTSRKIVPLGTWEYVTKEELIEGVLRGKDHERQKVQERHARREDLRHEEKLELRGLGFEKHARRASFVLFPAAARASERKGEREREFARDGPVRWRGGSWWWWWWCVSSRARSSAKDGSLLKKARNVFGFFFFFFKNCSRRVASARSGSPSSLLGP